MSLRRAPSALRTPISRVRSVTDDQHDVHDHDAAHHQRDGGDGRHHCAEVVEDVAQQVLEGGAGVDGESVRRARRQMAARAHDGAQLVLDRFHHRAAAARVHVDGHASRWRRRHARKAVSGIGDPVVHARAQHLALMLAHADHRVRQCRRRESPCPADRPRPAHCPRCRSQRWPHAWSACPRSR